MVSECFAFVAVSIGHFPSASPSALPRGFQRLMDLFHEEFSNGEGEARDVENGHFSCLQQLRATGREQKEVDRLGEVGLEFLCICCSGHEDDLGTANPRRTRGRLLQEFLEQEQQEIHLYCSFVHFVHQHVTHIVQRSFRHESPQENA